MKNYHKISFILIFLFIIPIIQAQPPFEPTILFPEEISIDFPQLNTFKQNTLIEFNFHTLNSSNRLTNETTQCIFHLFNEKGQHQINNFDLNFDVEGLDFFIVINEENFTRIGDYFYLVNCNTSNQIGSVSVGFEITPDGNKLTIYDSLIRIFLILFFIMLFMGTYFIIQKTDFKKWNNEIIKKYENKNIVKMVLSAIVFNIMKNSYIIYYLIGLPIVMIITNTTYVYNISGLVLFMNSFLLIYTLGIIIVGLIFLSHIQEWIFDIIEIIKNLDWGIEK